MLHGPDFDPVAAERLPGLEEGALGAEPILIHIDVALDAQSDVLEPGEEFLVARLGIEPLRQGRQPRVPGRIGGRLAGEQLRPV